VKVLPRWAKRMVRDKFEDFFVWLEDNWHGATGIPESADKAVFMQAGYGIKRLKGLLNFMDQEDWSERLPELQELIRLIDSQRNLDFKTIFPEMADLLE